MNSILMALQALASASAQFLSSALYRACVIYSRPIFPSLSKSTKKTSLKPVSLWTSEEGLLIRYTFSPPQAWAPPCLAWSSGPCPCPSSGSPQEFQLLLQSLAPGPPWFCTHVHVGTHTCTQEGQLGQNTQQTLWAKQQRCWDDHLSFARLHPPRREWWF